MNIIICGAGRVGFTIAKLLSEQNHSITVIDQSSEDIQKINDSLDVKGIVGKATYPSILEKADAVDADMIIAVTKNDEINMLICQIAYTVFNVPKKIARIRSQDYLNPKFSKVYSKENLPIDVIISPEIEIAKSIQRKLEAPGALDNVTFAQNVDFNFLKEDKIDAVVFGKIAQPPGSQTFNEVFDWKLNYVLSN